MTQDEIIELAVQAGTVRVIAELNVEILQAFAQLVTEKAVDDYLTLEREAELKARGEE